MELRSAGQSRAAVPTDENLRNLIVTTLEHMANGGVYDQLAGGFHRYSVDERWVVPHFEKMCYDNSELLKNYVHGYQATGEEFFANVARDIIRWMDEWLSDRERGGFYASQDADISMDDDGDYFTWTLEEARAVLTDEEAEVAALHYDINEVGEMHHNPAKNVLYVRASVAEIARRMNLAAERVHELLASARKKMYAARLRRPTPYVDKTVYVGWNSLVRLGVFGGGEGAPSRGRAAVRVALAGSGAGGGLEPVFHHPRRSGQECPRTTCRAAAARGLVLRSRGSAPRGSRLAG